MFSSGSRLEGMWSDCLFVIRNGERVLYDDRLAKRGTPTSEDYVTLALGDSDSHEYYAKG